MTNILTVAVDAELANRVAAIPGHHLVSIGRENFDKIHSEVPFHPNLILVGSGLSSEQAVRYAQRVLSDYPSMVVVLVAANPDHDLIREATRVGIRGVIRNTINDRELKNLIERANGSATPEAASGGHQIIVIASPKGGVGKTTVAVNLASLLAKEAPGEVALLDLDLQFGDVSSVLDLKAEFTVADALGSGASDSMLLRTLLVSHPSNFYVLCGADHPAATGPVTGEQVRKLVRQFANDFRYVLIDTSAGLQEETLASLEEATDVVFVATLDVATLRNVRKEVDVLAELGLLPERRRVVLNRTDRLSGLTQGDAESTLGLPVDAMIPASAMVPLAANHGRLAVEDKKTKNVRRPLEYLARAVSDQRKTPGRHR